MRTQEVTIKMKGKIEMVHIALEKFSYRSPPENQILEVTISFGNITVCWLITLSRETEFIC